jgi:hypothetical protein
MMNQTKIVNTLINELSVLFGINPDRAPILEQKGETPAGKNTNGRLIVIGVSHMTRLVGHLPHDTINMSMPRFKVTPSGVAL